MRVKREARADEAGSREVPMSESAVRVHPRKPETRTSRCLTVGRKFAEGGMALLKDAVDTNLMRGIAMKVLREEKAKDEDALARMVQEAQITAQLDHPNIVPVYELGIHKKRQLFYTMKKLQGRTLLQHVEEQDLSSRTESDLFRMIQVMLKVCDAVSYAHSKGVLHRDLNARNVIVGDFGQVYLMDWGIARPMSDAGSSTAKPGRRRIRKRREYRITEEKPWDVRGTPNYMPPEQAYGRLEAIDARSDVFALGAMLYEILTRTPPFLGGSAIELVLRARKCEIQPPDERVDSPLPAGLIRITMRALRKDPGERYQSVEELQRDLERFLEGSWHFPGRTYRPGELIVREGDRGDEAYIIRAGKCRVFQTTNGEKIKRRTIGVGGSFGQIAVFADRPRSASVEAVDEVTVAVVTRRHFEEELGLGTLLGSFVRDLAELFLEADRREGRFDESAEPESP